MNRFDRITAILIQLQSKKVVKAQDLADRFDISLRTVYRDIRTLEEAGVPLYGEAGVGYSIVDGYRLPPIMFTQEEAMAFLTADKLMEKFTDSSLQKNFSSAMYKVKSVLRGTEKDLVENLEEQIIVKDRVRNNTPPGNILDVLLKAIAEKKNVRMIYRAFGNEDNSERTIEPIGIFHEHENWYTIGYCHLRDAYRQFRADRIIDIKLTEDTQQERTSLKEFQALKEDMKASFTMQKAVILVEKNIALYLQEHRHYHGFVSEVIIDQHVEMTFLTQSIEYFARWFIMFADQAEIIEPQSLKDQVMKIFEKILKKNPLAKNTVDIGLS
ncbi:helix-turn-helix transcriptional regulator [Flavobacterium cerinum]|uniref:YafY family transcriptional regulator n=1 Tax=Flavobacterium cerinum TaxID=2502784 RepID=A0A444HB50_9FLAO|nr:YafY family protein [Flavobacterium cerinum]RWX00539.1 YafY family transcriptional regulator [Flavobacterium cerinum]